MPAKVKIVYVQLKHSLSEIAEAPMLTWLSDNGLAVVLKDEPPDDSDYLESVALQLENYLHNFKGQPISNCLALRADAMGNIIHIPFHNIAAFSIGREGQPDQE